jgi:predicted metal-binding protein
MIARFSAESMGTNLLKTAEIELNVNPKDDPYLMAILLID